MTFISNFRSSGNGRGGFFSSGIGAVFRDCVASNNGGPGFITTGDSAAFIGCTAIGNDGPGFLDASGEDVSRKNEIPNLIEAKEGFEWATELYKQKAEDSTSLRSNLVEIQRAFDMLNLQVQSEEPDENSIILWLDRIKDLSEVSVNDVNAREVFSFASSVTLILHKMRKTGILK
jgi:hypothetical protein